MRARGWIWIVLLAALAAFGGWRLSRGRAVETDLLAMLPETEQNPVAEQAIRSLARATGDRAVFLVRGGDPERSKAAALHLAGALERSGAFAEVQSKLPPIDPGMVSRFYAPHRFRLGCAEGSEGAADLRERIEARLASPQNGMSGVPAALDPLGDFAGFLAGLPLMSMRLEIQDDLLVVNASDGLYVLVSGGLGGSAYDPGVQKRALGAARAAEAELRGAFPEARVLETGILFYAADARENAEREMNLISLCSTLCLVGLFLAVFRSPRHLLLGLSCVAAGFAAATAVCLLIFGKLYLLTLACGSSIMGVAVDYAFLYFANHLEAGEAWEPRAVLRRIRPALLLGFATTLLGYAALLVAPFPGLRQIAVFSIVGLVGSLLTVLLVLPDLLERPIPPRARLLAVLGNALAKGVAASRKRGFRLGLALGAAALLGSLALLRVDDNVRVLIQPSRALQAQEAKIQELTGLSNSGSFFLVEGAGEGEVLAREERLRERLSGLLGSGGLEGVQSVSAFVPSPERQEASLAAQRRRLPGLLAAMGKVGFRPEILAALQRDFDASSARPLTVQDLSQATFFMPFRMLWLGRTPHGMASVVYPTGSPDPARLRQACAGLAGVSFVDKAQSVTDLLSHYRRLATWALGGAILLVWLLLAWRYGVRQGSALLLPALLGILAALAGVALTGTPFTLFIALALILILGFGVDYTIFLKEGGHTNAASLLGVALAGGATLVSYGLLSFSRTPVLRGFGIALALGVLGSVALAFLALSPRSGRTP